MQTQTSPDHRYLESPNMAAISLRPLRLQYMLEHGRRAVTQAPSTVLPQSGVRAFPSLALDQGDEMQYIRR